ncbi:MAG: GNAT family N-acetyltransferase, partial [Methanoregula sp.]|nr:GNAT family N-acetyltransferase [Methanoregula sp.]
VVIRPYRDGDFTEVAILEIAGVHERYRSAVFVRQMGALCPGTFLVAVAGTTVVGYTVGTIVQDDSKSGWVLRMMVKDGYRRRGTGTRLLDAVIDVLRARSIRTVYLTVSPKNAPAIRLYKNKGFVQIAEMKEYFGPGEDRFMMKREDSAGQK